MLKIKEEVNLEDLVKYGFMYRKHYDNWIISCFEKDYEDCVDNYIQVDRDRILKPFTRILNGHENLIDPRETNIKHEFMDKLFYLIQEGIIEQGETNENKRID